MSNETQGYEARILIEPGPSPHTFDADSEIYELDSESLRMTTTIASTNGLRGRRSHFWHSRRIARKAVGGRLRLPMTPRLLENFLPRILGKAPTGDVFSVVDDMTDAVCAFGVLLDKGCDVYQYADCKVARMTISGTQNSMLFLDLDVFGKTETKGETWPGTPPAYGETIDHIPYVFADTGNLTILANSYQVEQFELVLDNAIQPRFRNSLTATCLKPGDRIVTLRLVLPIQHSNALHDAGLVEDKACILPIVNGSNSLTWAFTDLVYEDATPVVNGRDEVMHEVTFTATTNDYSWVTQEVYATNVMVTS